MKISGFSMAKNASKLYYPLRPAIESLLPIVDEFVVAIGDNDEDDDSLEEIQKIKSDKVKIIRTVWDIEKYPKGRENAHQTDIALKACSGDWCFYLQADEVLHERYLDVVYNRCKQLQNDERVEGLLFNYKHFWGDYNHHINYHGWYPREIRVVRNLPDIHSFISAQSFRKIPNFDGISYAKREGSFKLNVASVDAEIYHYGWVRPPELMQKKSKALKAVHKGYEQAEEIYKNQKNYFDYGSLRKIPKFKDTHPKVMESFIKDFHWGDKLVFEKGYIPDRELMKHETTRAKILTFVEQKFFGGIPPFGYSNWNIIKV